MAASYDEEEEEEPSPPTFEEFQQKVTDRLDEVRYTETTDSLLEDL